MRERWVVVDGMDFGSGPSLTVAGLALADWGDPPGTRPRLWVDSLGFWERQPSGEIAADIRGLLARYGGPRVLYGDPSGRAAQHDQESWESSLRAGGVPLSCLPATFNDPFVIRRSLTEVQMLLDSGFLRIHAERCRVLLEAIESWEWDLPRGIPLKLVSKEQIKPRKDGWSHFGDNVALPGRGVDSDAAAERAQGRRTGEESRRCAFDGSRALRELTTPIDDSDNERSESVIAGRWPSGPGLV